MRMPPIFQQLLLILFLTSVSVFSQKQIVDVHYADFSQNLDSLQLNGDAFFTTDDLGNKIVRAVRCTTYISGSVFYKTPVSLLDPNGNGVSFSAFFRFRMYNAGGIDDDDGPGADGLAFVVQTVANNVGGVGSGMGFKGIPKSLGIEFDTYNNGYSIDNNNGNHIGIDTAGNIDSKKFLRMPKRLNDGDIWCAWVDYSGINQVLEVRFDSINVRPVNPIISDTLDLMSILGTNNAYFGFTAATGAGFANHDIIELRFINEFQPIDKNLINDSTYFVNEDETNGFVVGNISKDATYNFEYLFLPNAIDDFEVDSFSGEITVQADSGLSYDKKPTYNFDVVAIAFDTLSADLIDTIFDTATITININEILLTENFIDDQSFIVKDTASAMALVGKIATLNSNFDSLLILNNNSEFIVDPSNLDIHVSSSANLDYDMVSVYTFLVVAQKEYHKDDTALITINIEDVILNSNLIDDHIFTVYDSISSGAFIGQINTNSSLDSLIVIDIPKEFKFDQNNYSLFLDNNLTLNADSINLYEFMVIAIKESHLNDTALITINVEDVTYIQNFIDDQTFYVDEDILPLSFIGSLAFIMLPDTLLFNIDDSLIDYEFSNNIISVGAGQKLEYDIIKSFSYQVIAQKDGYYDDTATITFKINEVKIPEVNFTGYFDVDANGKVDSVVVVFSDSLKFPDKVTYNLSWIDSDSLYVLSDAVNCNYISIIIKENEEIKTSGKMQLDIYDESNGDSMQIEVEDRAAPVLTRAIYVNGKGDSNQLKTLFSEKVESFTSSSPFNFYRKNQNDSILYEILISKTESNGSDISWKSKVDTVTVVEYVFCNDSLNINVNDNIYDKNGNLQDNLYNRLIQLEIENNGFDVDITLISPFDPLKTDIPNKFKNIFDTPVTKGTIINIDLNSQIPLPESDLECSIYDVVGNCVYKCGGIDSLNQDLKIARVDEGRELIVYWGGRNDSRRLVGPGGYVIVLKIKPEKGLAIEKKVLVGVSSH